MCNLDVLQKYLHDSKYFADEFEEALFESDYIVNKYCKVFLSCHECPWTYVQVVAPKILFEDIKNLNRP